MLYAKVSKHYGWDAWEGQHASDMLPDRRHPLWWLLPRLRSCRLREVTVKWPLFFAVKQKLSQAIKSAIRYCRDNELMKEYFKEHEREVLNMVTFKWDDKRAGK